jgi:hypothetical protein
MHAFLLALLLTTAAGIRIEVRSPKVDVLPGEPIKLVLRWHGSADAEVNLDKDNRGLRYLQVWVDDGSGFRRYCEAPRGPVEGIVVRRLPNSPRPFIQNIALVHGEYADDCSGPTGKTFVFPHAGRYRLKLTYQPSGKQAVASNVLSFEAREPQGDDAKLLTTVRQHPGLLLVGGSRGALLAQFPNSPYMSYAKLNAFWEWETALHNREDPDTGQSLWHLSRDEYERFAKDQWRRKAQELMGEREWGAFDEERLGHALSAAKRSGDPDAAARIRAEAVTRFGDSQLVQRLREDETPDEEDEDGDEPPVKKPSPAPNR